MHDSINWEENSSRPYGWVFDLLGLDHKIITNMIELESRYLLKKLLGEYSLEDWK